MKLSKAILPAIAAVVAAKMAHGQEITPKWYQHINGSFGVTEANKLPILKSQGQESETLDGTELMDSYANLIRYNATRLLLGVRENGINEGSATPAELAIAAQYPDRSLIWIDAETGKPLGIAFKESMRPDLLAGTDVTKEGQGSVYAWWRVALDDGPEGQRALYSAFKHVILRYAPKADGGWESTPTVAYKEQVSGVGDGLTNGDGWASWRFRDFHVKGSGKNTIIYAGGGTWRAGHHPQVLVSTDGLTFTPKARVDNRDNGAARNNYALGGLSSFPVEYSSLFGGSAPKISVVYAGHFPGTGWPARPNRYALNPSNPTPSPAYNKQPNVSIYTRNESGYAGLPPFNWEAAGKDGLPIDHATDGVDRYDGNWNGALAADPSLSYIVGYSIPSWNNQFGDIKKPAWLAVHRLDGSIASGNSSFKLAFTEVDEEVPGNGGAGHDYLYDPWLEVNPDKTAAASSGKAEILATFGTGGFGVFTVQNVAASLVSSPSSQTVAAGSDVVIAANVTGSPNDFQWYKDGVALKAKSFYVGTTRKVALKITGVTSEDAGSYQLKWVNPISGAGQTVAAQLTVNGNAVRLAEAAVAPETTTVPVAPGSIVATGPKTFTVSGGGLKAFTGAADTDQAGDVLEFAYETVSGDFDKSIQLTSLTSGPVKDPVDARASAGLGIRVGTGPLSPSLLLNASNPLGENAVYVIGRAIEGQNHTLFSRNYAGLDKNLPNQWLRVRRAGNNFSFFVGTNGTTWTLIGQRYATLPGTLLVGPYAFSASYNSGDQTGGNNLAVAKFANYSDTVLTDAVAPSLVSVGAADKNTIGVKFSEVVTSESALIAGNYKLSQGTVTGIRPGIGGDTVYLSVSGLTSSAFTVTVLGGVSDPSGNMIAANSTASGKVSNWNSTDIGLIQEAGKRTPGDDPYVVGQVVAVSSGDTETEIEIVGGGSNAWNPGDFIHYLNNSTPLNGDFDVTVEVSRNDRPANTAGWANSGVMLRESAYLAGQEGTIEGTKVPMVTLTTYIDNDSPGRSAIPLWRQEAGGGYGNGAPVGWGTVIGGLKGYYLGLNGVDASGTTDAQSSPLSSRWLRIQRAGNSFTFLNSYDGKAWNTIGSQELPLASKLLFGFSTMNDTGGNPPPNNGYGGNGHLGDGDELFGNQNESNYSVQRVRIGTSVAPRVVAVTPTVSVQRSGSSIVITFTGKLQSGDSITSFSDVSGATSPLTVPADGAAKFYRAAQ